MHAVVRTYSGQGANALFDLLEQRKAEVESLIRGVSGFQACTLMRTGDGGISVTVCQDKAGADESLRLAASRSPTTSTGLRPPAHAGGLGPARIRSEPPAHEQQQVLEQLRGRGMDPSGKESEGHLMAEFFLSRPANEVAETPIGRLLA